MTRSDLIRATAKKAEKTIKETTVIVAALEDAVFETLKSGEDIEVMGFGSLKIKDVPEQTLRNPSTGKPVNVPAHKTVKAKISQALRDAAK